MREQDFQVINDFLEGYSVLEQVSLDLSTNVGEVTVLVEFADNFVTKKEWVKLQLKGISVVSVYANPADIPPELRQVQQPSQPFIEFLARLFRAQPIYEWSMFAVPSAEPATVQPTWQLIQSPDSVDRKDQEMSPRKG